MKKKRSILVVGLFLSEKNKNRIQRTPADQLAELLNKNGYDVVTTSNKADRVPRLIDTIFTILFHQFKFDVAILPLYGGFRSFIWEDITSKLLKLLGKKTILIVHGGSIPNRLKTEKKYLRSIQRADVVVCPSNYILSTLKEYGVESVLIENVIRLKDYHFHQKERFRPKIFWMRAFEDVYNPEMAVRVLALLKKKHPDATMVMAGYDRGALQMTKQLIADMNLKDSIKLPGYISNDQKNSYAEECDVYLCTNRIDNAPISLIEMMALGLPVISVNSGGIPYLVTHGSNGLLADLDDDEAIVEHINSIIQSPQLGKHLVKNGIDYCKSFNEEPVLQKWQQLFKSMKLNV